MFSLKFLLCSFGMINLSTKAKLYLFLGNSQALWKNSRFTEQRTTHVHNSLFYIIEYGKKPSSLPRRNIITWQRITSESLLHC